jgi:hypothetical protein
MDAGSLEIAETRFLLFSLLAQRCFDSSGVAGTDLALVVVVVVVARNSEASKGWKIYYVGEELWGGTAK